MVVDDFLFDVAFLVRNPFVLGLSVPFSCSNLDSTNINAKKESKINSECHYTISDYLLGYAMGAS